MPSLGLIAIVSGIITGVVVWLLVTTGGPLAWMVFLGWTSLVVLGGEDKSIVPNIASNILGVVMAWAVAVLSLLNPMPQLLSFAAWIGVLAGLAVVVYILASRIRVFSALSSASIAFAGSYGYLAHAPGAFTLDKLLSLSMENALILLAISIALGTAVGVLAGRLVRWLGPKARGDLR